MRFHVLHHTRCTDGTPVTESFNELRLKPVNIEHQSLGRFVLKAHPPPRLWPYSDVSLERAGARNDSDARPIQGPCKSLNERTVPVEIRTDDSPGSDSRIAKRSRHRDDLRCERFHPPAMAGPEPSQGALPDLGPLRHRE